MPFLNNKLFYKPHLDNILTKKLAEGIIGKYVHGDKSTLGVVELTKDSILPAHSHPHEQITMLLEGQLDMVIGGEKISLTPGMIHVIPSNVVHSAHAPMNCRLIDVFSPVREEYK